jgi:PAT family beta-lactamase induction signal transducer AmpG
MIEGVKVGDGIFYDLFGVVNGMGYTSYFYVCTMLAIPGMLLLFKVAPWNKAD